jgi:hypothetical protein
MSNISKNEDEGFAQRGLHKGFAQRVCTKGFAQRGLQKNHKTNKKRFKVLVPPPPC